MAKFLLIKRTERKALCTMAVVDHGVTNFRLAFILFLIFLLLNFSLV